MQCDLCIKPAHKFSRDKLCSLHLGGQKYVDIITEFSCSIRSNIFFVPFDSWLLTLMTYPLTFLGSNKSWSQCRLIPWVAPMFLRRLNGASSRTRVGSFGRKISLLAAWTRTLCEAALWQHLMEKVLYTLNLTWHSREPVLKATLHGHGRSAASKKPQYEMVVLNWIAF